MQFSTVAIIAFASQALAYSSVIVVETATDASTVTSTDYECAETVTDCPYKNKTSPISTYEGSANGLTGSFAAVAGAALAAGAILGL